jgi:GNAT superfamily N-acetyltransferase
VTHAVRRQETITVIEPTPEIVRVEEAQIEPIGTMLAKAFHFDPLAVHMIHDPEQRARSLPGHFRAFVRLGYLFGEVYTTRGTPQGAAVWFGPDGWDLRPEQLEEAGVGRLEHQLPQGAFSRFMEFFEYVDAFHKRDVSTEHWYLAILGVDPDLQGRRIGSTLLDPVFRRADECRLPCYLETDVESNVAYYRKLGFEGIVEDVEPSSGIRFWTLSRPPRLSASVGRTQ